MVALHFFVNLLKIRLIIETKLLTGLYLVATSILDLHEREVVEIFDFLMQKNYSKGYLKVYNRI